MEFVTVTTHDYNTISGFLINHKSEMPKAAILLDCFYDEFIDMYSRYIYTTKKGTKYYIRKHNSKTTYIVNNQYL